MRKRAENPGAGAASPFVPEIRSDRVEARAYMAPASWKVDRRHMSASLAIASSRIRSETSEQLLRKSRANELFIAIVAPAGAGAGTAAGIIASYLEREHVDALPFEVVRVKASDAIKAWAASHQLEVPQSGGRKTLQGIVQMQDRGDEMREEYADGAAVARALMGDIHRLRAEMSGRPMGEVDGKPRAFIIDSLRHPAEANLLRRIYQDAFTLVGVVCDPKTRDSRLRKDLFAHKDMQRPETSTAMAAFMDRDADAPEAFGQHVVDTFHEADFFVDNTLHSDDLADTGMNEALRRLVSLITSAKVTRPTVAETAMHQALSAQLRSACLSRQVGASLVDATGNVIATGTNEVPTAGGGVYGQELDAEVVHDERCAFRETKFCSSNREQNTIIEALIDQFPELATSRTRGEALALLRRTRIGGLLEFSRAVHAEMDVILSAARTGVSPRGTRLFVSTFPCHYCARHIVSAGIDEVQYIEPYPKSRALALHSDSITTDPSGWTPPSTTGVGPASGKAKKVLFRPFVGVAPPHVRPRLPKGPRLQGQARRDTSHGGADLGRILGRVETAVHGTRARLGASDPMNHRLLTLVAGNPTDGPTVSTPARTASGQLSLFDVSPANRVLCLPVGEIHGATFARAIAGARPTTVVDVRRHPYFDMPSLNRSTAFELFRSVPCRYLHMPIDLRPPSDQTARWSLRSRTAEVLDKLTASQAGGGCVYAFLVDRHYDVPVLEAAVRRPEGVDTTSWKLELPGSA